MQQYADDRYTAVVYTHSREFEPYSFTTDDFARALSYVVNDGGDNQDRDYGVVIDNRTKKTVFRYNGRIGYALAMN